MNDEDKIQEENLTFIEDTPIENDDGETTIGSKPGPQRFDISSYGWDADVEGLVKRMNRRDIYRFCTGNGFGICLQADLHNPTPIKLFELFGNPLHKINCVLFAASDKCHAAAIGTKILRCNTGTPSKVMRIVMQKLRGRNILSRKVLF
jgi:hypothetical protein